MPTFDHEHLDAYQVALEVVAEVYRVLNPRPRGYSDLVNQAQRAAISIPLNIAEGSGEFSRLEKARFYQIARRSATECVAALDVLRVLKVVSASRIQRARELLDRVVAMLTKMIQQQRTAKVDPIG
jgi:four helix bundle protein